MHVCKYTWIYVHICVYTIWMCFFLTYTYGRIYKWDDGIILQNYTSTWWERDPTGVSKENYCSDFTMPISIYRHKISVLSLGGPSRIMNSSNISWVIICTYGANCTHTVIIRNYLQSYDCAGGLALLKICESLGIITQKKSNKTIYIIMWNHHCQIILGPVPITSQSWTRIFKRPAMLPTPTRFTRSSLVMCIPIK